MPLTINHMIVIKLPDFSDRLFPSENKNSNSLFYILKKIVNNYDNESKMACFKTSN